MSVRYAFAGDRDVAVWVLEYLLGRGERPLALLLSGPERASHAAELEALCSFLPPERVLRGGVFREPAGVEALRALELDLLVCIHFPYLVPAEVLEVPKVGVLNLHPAFLPYNRGWHTPSWALLEGTPVGATLHFMDAGLDTGDVVHQERLHPSPADTANTLYAKLKRLELQVFEAAWPGLAAGSFPRVAQPAEGTAHKRADLAAEQRIDPGTPVLPGELIDRLRALTTSRVDEAAYLERDGRRYRIQVAIHEEDDSPRTGPAPAARPGTPGQT